MAALGPLAAAVVDPFTNRPALAAATPSILVGCTAYSGALTADDLDQLTGRAARVVRVYHKQGTPVPTTASAARILAQLQAGRHVLLSLKVPDASSATIDACDALAADIAAHGFAGSVWTILWHEPFPELTASGYIARYRPLAPAIRRHGVACGVCFHTYPIWHKGLDYTTYWPGNDLTDFLAIDTYPGDAPNNQGLHADPLATISPLTSFAKAQPKPFIVAELGVDATQAAADPAAATAWIERFESLGSHCRAACYYNGVNPGQNTDFGLQNNSGLLVPAYQSLHDHFGG